MMSSARGWISLHIHFHGDQDALLVRCIRPLADRLRREGVAARLFFLRHWQRGPHVRLRVQPADGPSCDALEVRLLNGIAADLRAHPNREPLDIAAFRRAAEQFSRLENAAAENGALEPDNTVRVAPYEPETGKYGGPAGVRIAQDVFDVSSACALAALPRLAGAYQSKLGHGFVMMLRAMVAFGILPEEMSRFLRVYQGIWASCCPPGTDRRLRAVLASNGPRLERSAEVILAGKGAGPVAERWAEAIGAAAVALTAEPGVILAATGDAPDPEARCAWLLLMQYLHTHNNRLGIGVGDEAFLAFIGEETLRRVLG